MEETKQCPYCKEEIKVEAIKCKHCGEFIEQKKVENAQQFEIPYLDYEKAMFYCFGTIAVSFLVVFVDLIHEWRKLYLLGCIGEVVVWVYFYKYIRAYNNKKISNSILWIIGLVIVLSAVRIISVIFESAAQNYNPTEGEWLFLVILFFLFALLYVIIYLRVGVKLIRFKNDEIGLINTFGWSLATLALTGSLIYIIGSGESVKIIQVIGLSMYNIPYLLMGMLFYRLNSNI